MATSPPFGVVTLGQVAARLAALEVSCNRCDWRGRLRTARLVAEHGPALPIPELLRIISADCPRRVANRAHDVCGAHLPDLARLTR